MGGSLRRLGEASCEKVENRVLADDQIVAREQHGDRHHAGSRLELVAILAVDWHLVHEIVEPELGQPLAHASRGRAPLRLVQLEHTYSVRLPASAGIGRSAVSPAAEYGFS